VLEEALPPLKKRGQTESALEPAMATEGSA
jgi:hypothetical protein